MLNSLFCNSTQRYHTDFTISEIHIYKYYPTGGFTNGHAYRTFDELDSLNVQTFQLDSNEVNIFSDVLSKAKTKKLFPFKLASNSNMLFVKIITNEGQTLKLVILNGLIRNFTSHKDYWIKDESLQLHLSAFLLKLRNR